ncbi:MAG TPA: hypothetical protein VMW72_11040 [Sedimentisphaerales bacterium]|nr:hypothetical protein [Sedimentisphaerales bacterium]
MQINCFRILRVTVPDICDLILDTRFLMLDSGFRILDNKHPLRSPFDPAQNRFRRNDPRQRYAGASNPRQCRGLTIRSGSDIYGWGKGGSRTAPTFGNKDCGGKQGEEKEYRIANKEFPMSKWRCGLE